MYAKKAFTFLPAFLLVLVSNHRPAIPETTHAAWRRVLLVPFGVRIQEDRRDRNLPARLRLEGDGILRWLVDGCREALATGLRPPAAVVAATAAYREAENPLSAFFAERCLLGSPYTCNATTLYAGYRSWAESAGEHPRSQRWFGLRLGELGLTKRTSSTTTWFGIALRPAGHRGLLD